VAANYRWRYDHPESSYDDGRDSRDEAERCDYARMAESHALLAWQVRELMVVLKPGDLSAYELQLIVEALESANIRARRERG
jgi:hypothetical protein